MPDDIKFPEGEDPAELHEHAEADETSETGLPSLPEGRPKPD